MVRPIILFGASGYIGCAILAETFRRNMGDSICAPHSEMTFGRMLNLFEQHPRCVVVNAAAFIPPDSVAKCDDAMRPTIEGNVVFPAMLAHACEAMDMTLVHISTGCLWNDGQPHIECDLPMRAFEGPCGFYVGTKCVSERAVSKWGKHYILRIRLPFDQFDHPRNYLSKLASFEHVYDHTNSLTHRGDFAKMLLDLLELDAPYGTYHCTNPGFISADSILLKMWNMGLKPRCTHAAPGPKTDCQLNVDKLLSTGVKMRTVHEAIDDSLKRWTKYNV